MPRQLCNRTLEDVTTVFSDILLTPEDLNTTYGGMWPSRAVLIADGKRLFVESNDYFKAYPASFSQTLFYPTTWNAVQEGALTTTPFPACAIAGDASWYSTDSWVRILDGSVVWPPEQV